MNAFRILVADDHPIFRFGLCSLLRAHDLWEVCGEASDGRDAVRMCSQLRPDLVVLDISMPKLNGLDAARQILKDYPAQRMLVLIDLDSEQVIRELLEAGVRGLMFKSDETEHLLTAVEALQRHSCIFSSRVSDLILENYLGWRRPSPGAVKVPKLSPREREVVQLLGEGKSTKEVATILNVAAKTAETHRSNIMLKLKLHSIAELVLYAVRNEIVQVRLPSVLQFPNAMGEPGMPGSVLATNLGYSNKSAF